MSKYLDATPLTYTPDAPESALYVTYILDSAGNRTNMNDGSSVSYVPNDLNQYGSVGGASVGYGPNGNLTSYGGWSYSYDADNRLVSAVGGGHTLTFVYDGLGRCVQRTIDGTTATFTYDGWQPIAEWNSANSLGGQSGVASKFFEICRRQRALHRQITDASPS